MQEKRTEMIAQKKLASLLNNLYCVECRIQLQRGYERIC